MVRLRELNALGLGSAIIEGSKKAQLCARVWFGVSFGIVVHSFGIASCDQKRQRVRNRILGNLVLWFQTEIEPYVLGSRLREPSLEIEF